MAWLCTGEVRVIPSSFSLDCRAYEGSITVVSNGSRFLYFMDAACRRRVCTAKLPSSIRHVSQLCSGEAALPVAVCCLCNGTVLAVPVETVISREAALSSSAPLKPDPATPSSSQTAKQLPQAEDILATLFGDTEDLDLEQGVGGATLQSRSAVPCGVGELVYEIASLRLQLPANAALCSVHVCAKRLFLFYKARSTREETISISASSTVLEIDGYQIPVFSEAPFAKYTVSLPRQVTGSGLPDEVSGLQGVPAFAIVCQADGKSPRPSSSVHRFLCADLFLQLFGPECSLSHSPVALLCSGEGRVYYWSLGAPPPQNELQPLCSLEEPVQAVHALCLPRDCPTDGDGGLGAWSGAGPRELEPVGATALVFVGRGGKMLVGSVGGRDRVSAHFSEFQLPSPILSSQLLPDYALLFSTGNGVFGMCIRPKCTKSCSEAASLVGPILIPSLAFQFPVHVSKFPCFLLSAHARSAPPTPDTPTSTLVAAMSLHGQVRTLEILEELQSCETLRGKLPASCQLQNCLSAIEVAAKRTETMKETISSFDFCLSELSEVLCVFQGVENPTREGGVASEGGAAAEGKSGSQSDAVTLGPFSCSISAAFDFSGVAHAAPCVEVKVRYHSSGLLHHGWSVVVQLSSDLPPSPPPPSHSPPSPPPLIVSRIVPLAGMTRGFPLVTRLRLPHSLLRPLDLCVSVSLHYDMSRLLSLLQQSEPHPFLPHPPPCGAVLTLCSRRLDILDFLRHPNSAHRTLPPELGTHTPSPPTQCSLDHRLAVPVPDQDRFSFSLSLISASVLDQDSSSPLSDSSSLRSDPSSRTPDFPAPSSARQVPPPVHRVAGGRPCSSAPAELQVCTYDGSLASLGEEPSLGGATLLVQAATQAVAVEVSGSVRRRLREARERPHREEEGMGSRDLEEAESQCDQPHQSLSQYQGLPQEVAALQQDLWAWQAGPRGGSEMTISSLVAEVYSLFIELRGAE